MTPNKLPPLPESLKNLADIVAILLKPVQWRTYKIGERIAKVAEEMNAAEALRQSQSLPAGAVAGWLDGESYMSPKTKARLIEAGKAPGASIGEVTFGKIAEKHDTPLYAAIQADASEKGEAVAWQWRYISPEEGPGLWQTVDSERIVAMFRDKADHETRALYATQPAQASEAMGELIEAAGELDAWHRLERQGGQLKSILARFRAALASSQNGESNNG